MSHFCFQQRSLVVYACGTLKWFTAFVVHE